MNELLLKYLTEDISNVLELKSDLSEIFTFYLTKEDESNFNQKRREGLHDLHRALQEVIDEVAKFNLNAK